MLDDAAIERWSRQILLDEVGGRGQERLGATTVALAGEGPAADFAATLVAAAGCRMVRGQRASGVVATVGNVTVLARGRRVVTLVGRPCVQCASDRPADDIPNDAAVAQAIGALVAAEVLRAALGLATEGRTHTIDPARGVFTSQTLPATAGCRACASGS